MILAATVTLIAVIPFLFSPRVPRGTEDAHWVSVTDWGPVHLTINADSQGFEYLARDPGLALKQSAQRQSRPLYGVLGWIMAAPFRAPGLQTLGLRLLNRQHKADLRVHTASYFPEYAGLVTLNFTLLVMTVMLLQRVLGAESLFETRMLFPLVVVLVNPVTKAFFWTPHEQIFIGLIGVASIFLVARMRQNSDAIRWTALLGIGFALGVLSLAYGAFAVPAAASGLCLLFQNGRQQLLSQLPKRTAQSAVLLSGFFVPLVGWILFVKLHTGSFYSHETGAFKEFVWLAESLRSGPAQFSHEIALRIRDYGRSLLKASGFAALVLAVLSLVRLRVAVHNVPGWHNAVGFGVWCFLAANVPFFFLLGVYWERLAWSIVPALVVAIGLTSESIESALSAGGRQILRAGMAALSIGYAVFWITTAGPWS